MDLIGRKWMQAKGKAFASILQEVDDFIAANKGKVDGLEKELEFLEKAWEPTGESERAIGGFVGSGKIV
jgi:hypothetical protein